MSKTTMAISGILVTTTASAILGAFSYFAPLSIQNELKAEHSNFITTVEFQKHVTPQLYESYYNMHDRWVEALEKGNTELAAEYERRLARLRAQICAVEPTWEKCS